MLAADDVARLLVMSHSLTPPGTQYQGVDPGAGGFRLRFGRRSGKVEATVIVSWADEGDGTWLHASIAHPDRLPTYGELCALHAAVFTGPAYQVFVGPDEHVNIHPYALHLWGRQDGQHALPNFGRYGTI